MRTGEAPTFNRPGTICNSAIQQGCERGDSNPHARSGTGS